MILVFLCLTYFTSYNHFYVTRTAKGILSFFSLLCLSAIPLYMCGSLARKTLLFQQLIRVSESDGAGESPSASSGSPCALCPLPAAGPRGAAGQHQVLAQEDPGAVL